MRTKNGKLMVFLGRKTINGNRRLAVSANVAIYEVYTHLLLPCPGEDAHTRDLCVPVGVLHGVPPVLTAALRANPGGLPTLSIIFAVSQPKRINIS
jgi:hypothetical protein